MSISEANLSHPSVADARQSCEKNSSAKGDSAHSMRFLPDGFSPGEHDVLCGRGRKCFNHPGNVKFREIVQGYLPQYSKAMTKLEKSYILSDVVEKVRKNSGIGGFVKKNEDGRWYEVGDFLAREKTSQAFRDVLHDKYKSSNTSKKKRRQEEQAEKLFRGHSNRSLDAASVHTAGSTPDGDAYSIGQESGKLMRIERPDMTGFMVEKASPNDLLGALDMELANSFMGRKGLASQRSQRSVMEFDRRQQMMRQTKSGSTSINQSCPNLFNKSLHTHQQSYSMEHPPIPTQVVLEDSVMEPTPLEHMDTFMDTFDANSLQSRSNGGDYQMGVPAPHLGQPPQSESWMHHSQPNLFTNAPHHNPAVANRRRQFARMPPRRHGSARDVMLVRHNSLRNMRTNSLKNVVARQNSGRNLNIPGPPGSHLMGDSSHNSQYSNHTPPSTSPMNDQSTGSTHSRHSMTVFEEQLDSLALSDRAPPPPPRPSREEPEDIDVNELVLSPLAGETKDTLLASLASLSDSFAIDPIEENPYEPMSYDR